MNSGKVQLVTVGNFELKTYPQQLFKSELDKTSERLKIIKSFFAQQASVNGTIKVEDALWLIEMAEKAVMFKLIDNYENLPQTFQELFEDTPRYEKVISLLIEHQWIDSVNGNWVKKGSSSKRTLVWFLKVLENKGYFRIKLTSASIIIVVHNSFKQKIRIDTINRIKHSTLKDFECPFINEL